jgi:hypothetical protein
MRMLKGTASAVRITRVAKAFRSAEGRSEGAAGTTESLFQPATNVKASHSTHFTYLHFQYTSLTPSSPITYNDFHSKKLD